MEVLRKARLDTNMLEFFPQQARPLLLRCCLRGALCGASHAAWHSVLAAWGRASPLTERTCALPHPPLTQAEAQLERV